MFCNSGRADEDDPSDFVLAPSGNLVDCSAVFAVVVDPDERERFIKEKRYVLLTNFEAVSIGRLYEDEMTGDALLEIFCCSDGGAFGNLSGHEKTGYRPSGPIETPL